MKRLMSNISWVLGRKEYATYEDFIGAVTDYNKKLNAQGSMWDPNHEVAIGPIKVVYEALWKDDDDTIEVEIGETGTKLTMGQILYQLNNATYEFFKDADQRFFEGLAAMKGAEYELLIGS